MIVRMFENWSHLHFIHYIKFVGFKPIYYRIKAMKDSKDEEPTQMMKPSLVRCHNCLKTDSMSLLFLGENHISIGLSRLND